MARGKPRKSKTISRTARREKRYSIKANLASIARFKSRAAIASAKELSVIAPELKPLARKRVLTPAQKAKVTRFQKRVRGIRGLKPVSAAFARKHKAQLFAPGIRAIQLQGATDRAVLTDLGKDFTLSQNGRTYVLWKLNRDTVRSKKGMRAAADKAYRGDFPIDILQKLAAKAFKTLKPLRVFLWTNHGISPPGFDTFNQFALWIETKWQQGKYVSMYETKIGPKVRLDDPGAFVRGIAILISEEPVYGGALGAAKTSEMG